MIDREMTETFQEHTGRVFRLQFDEFQIVSSSHDDTILIWDFLNYNQDNPESPSTRNGNGAAANALNGSGDAGGRSPSRKFRTNVDNDISSFSPSSLSSHGIKCDSSSTNFLFSVIDFSSFKCNRLLLFLI
jgi:hypothetical protein